MKIADVGDVVNYVLDAKTEWVKINDMMDDFGGVLVAVSQAKHMKLVDIARKAPMNDMFMRLAV